MRKLGALVVVMCVACGAPKRDPGGGDDDSNPDSAIPDPGGDAAVQTFVYAHTSSQLYKVDPDTLAVSLVGTFGFNGGFDQITDIAIDKNHVLIGISFTSVYRIDPAPAACTP